VFTETGFCAGVGIWREGKNLAITVWGDDSMTAETDGMTAGGNYRFSIWSAGGNCIYDAQAVFADGGASYEPNAVAILETLTAGDVPVGVGDSDRPLQFLLSHNYPNPFNPVTTIPFTVPRECRVVLTVYNVAGEKVAVIADDVFPAGTHDVEWNASLFSSGIYFCRMEAQEYLETRKLTLVK